ncbi:MAG TPA: type II toxin-antitoxin system RatA family toxin [Burkholderiales bacterium]|nr:type II toxin-antitoxin system RatA family toxin [Burkholderiales bacterium]
MPEIRKTVLVAHSQAQMFELVDAVERYPEFLPWCGGASVSYRDETKTRATIEINFRGIRQKFTTENDKVPPQAMAVKLVEGPFRALDGDWGFLALPGGGCKIEFRLHYEFAGRILEKLVGPVFQYIANTMVDAFVRRAEAVYGPQS